MKYNLSKHLKINQLRLICAIAEHGQLGLAANEIAITQPAASRMLSEIESTMQAKLFERLPKGMELTLIGHRVAQRAHNMLVELRDMSRDVDEMQRGDRGIVSVGAVTGAAVGFVIPAIRQLKATSPKTEINVNVDTSDILVQDLIVGKNDFVLARLLSQFDTNDFEIYPAKSEQVKLIVREDHPMANAKQVSLKDLTAYEWVIQSQRAPMSEAVNNAFLNAGLRPPESITNTTSLLVMMSILISSSAIAPLASEVAELLVKKLDARLKVLKLQEPVEMSPYFLLQIKGRQLSPAAERLRALVIQGLKQSK